MTAASKKNIHSDMPDNKHYSDENVNIDDNYVFDPDMFNANSASVFLSAFKSIGIEQIEISGNEQDDSTEGITSDEPETCPKSASVKFMITRQEESALQKLGYSQEQIYRLKPHEAAKILKADKGR